MSKSHVKELSDVVKHLLKDACAAFPALRGEFERDLERFDAAVCERGLPFLTEQLPELRKHLDRCLSDGKYVPSNLPLTKRVSAEVIVPRFLRGLYLLIFDSSGDLLPEPNIEAIFFLRQIYSVCGKVELPCGPDKIKAALAEFYQVDDELPEPDRFWNVNRPTDQHIRVFQGFAKEPYYLGRIEKYDAEMQVLLKLALINLDRTFGLITSDFGPYRFEDWKFRHGPGAISQVSRPTNKYNWFNWSSRLGNSFPFDTCGFHSVLEWVMTAMGRGYTHPKSVESYSRLVVVPKTLKAPRLIAAEPSEHQWCQQNIWHYFCDRADKTWVRNFVRFRDQSLNQQLCLAGSREGLLCTVDLSSASDRVSCLCVGQAFRGNHTLLRALQASRTRVVGQEVDQNFPRFHRLKKFSTMGSACTFPVETLIFLGVALASTLASCRNYATRESISSLTGGVAVFGDDIIVPVYSRTVLFALLEVLNFKVNASKSFWNGQFRESCGVDAFRGHDVTPIYYRKIAKDQPEVEAANLQVSNNFFEKFLIHTAQFVASTLRFGERFPVVNIDSGASGLKTFCNPKSFPNLRERYNRALQRWEYLVPLLVSRVQRTSTQDASALLQYFTEDPCPLDKWQHGFAQRPKLKTKFGWVDRSELVRY